MTLETFGAYIRRLRENKSYSLNKVASHVKMDISMLSKIERGDRQLNKDHIPLLAEALETNKVELEAIWLADQLFQMIHDNPNPNQLLKSAIKKINDK